MTTDKNKKTKTTPGFRPPASLAFVDLETTGVDPNRHDIIEVAVIKVSPRSFRELDRIALKIQPADMASADPQALQVNGYNEQDWSEAVSLRSGLDKVSQLLHGSILAGHNVGFDKAFLESGFKKANLPRPKWDYHTVDTASLAFPLRAEGYLDNLTLNSLCLFFGIERPRPHRAEADAEAALAVYKQLALQNEWSVRLSRLNPCAQEAIQAKVRQFENCECHLGGNS